MSAGCNSVCQIECSPLVDGGPTYFGPSSNHCYFTSKERESYQSAASLCESQQAHLVTFVDDDEVTGVHNFASYWPTGSRYWVGLNNDAGNAEPYSAASSFTAPGSEPGWDAVHCTGCFAYGATGPLPTSDGGSAAGPSDSVVVTGLGSDNGTLDVVPPNERAEVVCEREPIGSRSTQCNNGNAWCFTVLATASGSNPKSYVYYPVLEAAAAADATCRLLSKHALLVLFDTRAEREQVIYELFQLSAFQAVEFPGQFWIGLSAQMVSPDAGVDAGGHGIEWVWDDGKLPSLTSSGPRPAIWGNNQPSARTAVRAYINVQFGDTAYDHGLAYAHDEGKNPTTYPFVCQLQD
jgi:hypothetical protein